MPSPLRVLDVSERVRIALEEFERIEATTKYDVAHWLTGPYRRTLAGGRVLSPLVVGATTSDVGSALDDARAALARAREAARSLDGRLVEILPPRVHVVRVKDVWESMGFAPIDVRGATLTDRVLSVLLADYLMHPEAYVGAPRASEDTLPELDLVSARSPSRPRSSL